jgi:hypothetical protein
MIWKKSYKKLWIILCLIANPAQAEFRHFNKWTASEKRLFVAYNTIAYIDHRQTRVGLRNGYKEVNPIYGHAHRDKSAAINLAISGLMYYGIGTFPEDDTTGVMLGAILSRTAVVYHNDSIGISWKVAF